MDSRTVLSHLTRAHWQDMTAKDREAWGQEDGERIGKVTPHLWFIQVPGFVGAFDPFDDPDKEDFFRWFRVVESM